MGYVNNNNGPATITNALPLLLFGHGYLGGVLALELAKVG